MQILRAIILATLAIGPASLVFEVLSQTDAKERINNSDYADSELLLRCI